MKAGMGLVQQASSLMQGGFTMDKLARGKALFEEASSLWKRFQSGGEEQEEGVGEEHFVEDWKSEHKFVTMFSGCRDDQTSADASIGGESVGAMSWAFLETMKRNPNPKYLDVSLDAVVALLATRRWSALTAFLDTATDKGNTRPEQISANTAAVDRVQRVGSESTTQILRPSFAKGSIIPVEAWLISYSFQQVRGRIIRAIHLFPCGGIQYEYNVSRHECIYR